MENFIKRINNYWNNHEGVPVTIRNLQLYKDIKSDDQEYNDLYSYCYDCYTNIDPVIFINFKRELIDDGFRIIYFEEGIAINKHDKIMIINI